MRGRTRERPHPGRSARDRGPARPRSGLPDGAAWLETLPRLVQDLLALRLVREHTTTPLAIGEVFNTVFDYQTLVGEQLIDYVRSAVTHFGGVSPLKKLFDYAAQHQIKSAIHGPEDISPVGMAAAIHLDLAIHNFGIQEHSGHTDLTNEVFRHAYTFSDGHLHPGESPGIGVELDAELAAAPTCPPTGCRTAQSTTGESLPTARTTSRPWVTRPTIPPRRGVARTP